MATATKVEEQWFFFGSSIFKDLKNYVEKGNSVIFKSGGGIKDVADLCKKGLPKPEEGQPKREIKICLTGGSNDLLDKGNKVKPNADMSKIVDIAKTLLKDLTEMSLPNSEITVVWSSVLPRLYDIDLTENSDGKKILQEYNKRMKRHINGLVKKGNQVIFIDNDENFTLKSGEAESSLYKDKTHLSDLGNKRLLKNCGYKPHTGKENKKEEKNFLENIEFEGTFIVKIKIDDVPWCEYSELFQAISDRIGIDKINQLLKTRDFWIIGVEDQPAYEQLTTEGFKLKEKTIMAYDRAKKFSPEILVKIGNIPIQCKDSFITSAFERKSLKVVRLNRLKYPNTMVFNGDVEVYLEHDTNSLIPRNIDIANQIKNVPVHLQYKKPVQDQNTLDKEKGSERAITRICYICRGREGQHLPEQCPWAKACYNCGKKNHLVKSCWENMPMEQSGKQNTPRKNAPKATEEKGDDKSTTEIGNEGLENKVDETNSFHITVLSPKPINKKAREKIQKEVDVVLKKGEIKEGRCSVKNVFPVHLGTQDKR